MKNVEAIDVLRDMRDGNFNWTEKQRAAIDCAVCFMMAFNDDHEYRTAKAPKKTRISKLYQCPECGKILMFQESQYCSCCGQALNWPEEEG